MTTTGTLENWHKDHLFNIIWGDIHGDTKGRFVNGTRIHTSDLRPNQELKEGSIIQTLNSSYKLGKRFGNA